MGCEASGPLPYSWSSETLTKTAGTGNPHPSCGLRLAPHALKRRATRKAERA